ncbi:MAG TPA: trypsin-like peptidase domain-containing protein, partial [Planctomycetaceae bacterium]|nr:trypsin-like peptidase domain-containing protein [Planctomycetaceae bacterium]
MPDEMLVLLGQPSAWRVEASGTLDVTTPREVIVDLNELRAGYLTARNDNLIPADITQPQAYWLLIAKSPAKYLKGSQAQITRTLTLSNSGTAFAVSREGILLTNAHVVAVDAQSLTGHPAVLAETLAECLDSTGTQLNCPIEGNLRQQVATLIFLGLEAKGIITVALKDQRIQLRSRVPIAPKPELRLGGLQPRQDQGIPVRVIAKGSPFPGRDVAVLRTTHSEDFVMDRDRLICLRLGDSDDVRPGTRVQAFGFPAKAFSPNMPEESRRLVSCQNGQIGQIKPLLGEMPVVFEMTADINHGDSGGPVIDKFGRVIGLNVAGYAPSQDTMLSGHTMAVPVNVARELLKKAGFARLDPGPLTESWERGLRHYTDGRYAEAEQEFARLLRMETTGWAEDVS